MVQHDGEKQNTENIPIYDLNMTSDMMMMAMVQVKIHYVRSPVFLLLWIVQ